ncbi:MAG: glycosyltransferase family 2 protein [Candidatus Omnitrophica bacterium]|nr:glycosyltransferase family 2 protein [Candidatus Omnitrophota bacterium]
MKSIKQNNTLIIIPVYNEEKSIGSVINNLLKYSTGNDILVVCDGSTDKTLQVLEKYPIAKVSHIFNLGVGASLQTGCLFALRHDYSYIIRMDGDGQHNPVFINDILFPLKNGEADIVIGSRFLGNSEFKTTFSRLLGISIIAWFLGLITGRKITDPTSGFCAMNQSAIKFFAQNCPEDFPEPEILLYHREYRIKEVPISINRRTEGVSSITALGSVYYMVKVMLSLSMHLFRRRKI